MRSPDVGLERLRSVTGAGPTMRRLHGVQLDVDDPTSIAAAAREVLDTVGAPDGLVHNAGVAGVGCVEEMPAAVYQQIFSTNFFGPVLLTKELLPAMRAAGRGRIVVVSSEGGMRGMPGISAYSAAKGALERWAESLSQEIAPFGLGVTVLVAGTFKTDILELTTTYADPDGPYADLHARAGAHRRPRPAPGGSSGTVRARARPGAGGRRTLRAAHRRSGRPSRSGRQHASCRPGCSSGWSAWRSACPARAAIARTRPG